MLNQARQDVTLDQNERTAALASRQRISDTAIARADVDAFKKEGTDVYNQARAGYDSWSDAAKTKFNTDYGSTVDEFLNKAGLSDFQNKLQDWIEDRYTTAGYNYGVGRFGRRVPIDVENTRPIAPVNWLGIKSFNPGQFVSRKRGGTLNFNEHAILDNQKEVHKALQKADDRLLKLILKMLS